MLHKCDNPACVRPDHLFTGTALDNSQDMVAKGRWSAPKLTSTQRAEIVRKNKEGTPQRALAKQYGVCQPSISYTIIASQQ